MLVLNRPSLSGLRAAYRSASPNANAGRMFIKRELLSSGSGCAAERAPNGGEYQEPKKGDVQVSTGNGGRRPRDRAMLCIRQKALTVSCYKFWQKMWCLLP